MNYINYKRRLVISINGWHDRGCTTFLLFSLSHKLNWNFLFHFVWCTRDAPRVARWNNSEWNETISTCRHIFSLISFTSLLHFFAFVVINFTKCLHNISFHTLASLVDVVSTLNSNDISSNLAMGGFHRQNRGNFSYLNILQTIRRLMQMLLVQRRQFLRYPTEKMK